MTAAGTATTSATGRATPAKRKDSLPDTFGRCEGGEGIRQRPPPRSTATESPSMASMAQTASNGHWDGRVVDGRPRRTGETQIPALGCLWKARGDRGRTENLPSRSSATKLPFGGATAMAASGESGRCPPGPGTAGDDRDDPPLDYRRQGKGPGATRAPRTIELLLGTAGPGKGF